MNKIKSSVLNVCNCRGSSITAFVTDTGERIQHLLGCHQSDVQAVDFHGDLIISGSRDATVKVFLLSLISEL